MRADQVVSEQHAASVRHHRWTAALGKVTAGVVHELRNGLFAVSAMVDILRQESTTTPGAGGENSPTQPVFDLLESEIQRMSTTLQAFVEYGDVAGVARARVAIADVVESSIVAQEPTPFPARFDVEIEGGLNALLDRERVALALAKVLDNANVFAPDHSTVRIHCRRTADPDSAEWVVIEVRDRGPGFPPDELERVFEPFHSHRPRRPGLGLSYAQRVVLEHGGKIEACNHDDAGAIVRLYLPLGVGPATPAKAADDGEKPP